ncbi:MAG TPA: carbon-nitrogen hydrolase [bacterium]|nr:carbon-nitrogen hydrolase [bacterium]
MKNKKSAIVRIGLIQTSCEGSAPANFEKTARLIRRAARKGAQIVCTQELFTSPYFCQTEDIANFALAERVDETGPTVQALSALARELKVVIVASLFEKRARGVYHNTAAVIDADGKYLGKYRKMHIPDDPHYYEKFYFSEGDLGYKVFRTRYADIGVLICWDQWYPEAARLTALKGAQIIFYPTAIGWLPRDKKEYGGSQHGAWETVQRSHAIANGCYVASVNRVGFEKSSDGEGGIEFWGQSFVADTYGRVVKKGSVSREEILVVPVDLAKIDETRAYWPFFRDRRIATYGDIQKRCIDE